MTSPTAKLQTRTWKAVQLVHQQGGKPCHSLTPVVTQTKQQPACSVEPSSLTPMPLPTSTTKAMVMSNELPAMPIKQVKSPAKVITLHSSQRRPIMPYLRTHTHTAAHFTSTSSDLVCDQLSFERNVLTTVNCQSQLDNRVLQLYTT